VPQSLEEVNLVEIQASRQTVERPSGLAAYLVVGAAWFLFLVFASRVKTVEPVFLWVMAQGLLLEKLSRGSGWGWGILLIAYLSAGCVAWLLFERSRRDPSHTWRRAILSWLGIQAVFCVVVVLLGKFGILYE
jgi:hypothetical protein